LYKNTVCDVRQFTTCFDPEGYHRGKAFFLHIVWHSPDDDLGQNK